MTIKSALDSHLNFKPMRSSWLVCASGLAIIMASASGAAAQVVTDETVSDVTTAAETREIKDDQSDDEIVTTGTRIAGGSPASPILQISRAEIDARGLSSVDDILRYIPQNQSSLTSGGVSTLSTGGFTGGVSTVNLRGLGEGSTLVLVNGKRIAASPTTNGTFTDISTIPFGAIERVEILTDGASAIYGSDAVGGVVNFIMKKDYAGAKSHIRYENSSSGGHAYTADQTVGFGWGSGNILANISYTKEEAVDRFKAGLTDSVDYTAQGGADYSNNVRFRQAGQPASRDGSLLRTLTPERKQLSGYVSLTQSLAETVTLNLSGQYSNRDSSTELIGHPIQARVPGGSLYNPGARPRIARYSALAEVDSGALDPSRNEAEAERYSLNGSLDWEMPVKDWEMTLSVGKSVDKENSLSRSIVWPDDQNVLDALASNDPNIALNLLGDGSMQRPDLNSLISVSDNGARQGEQETFGVGITGTAVDLPAGPAKFSIGAEWRNDSINYKDYRLNPIGRSDASLVDFAPEAKNQALFGELHIPIIGDDSQIGEISVQLAGRYDNYDLTGPFDGFDQNTFELLPFSSTSYDAFLPKVGVVWYPTEGLKLRGTWSEAFQAPTIPELFEPRLIDNSFPNCVDDPLNPIPSTAPSAFCDRFFGRPNGTEVPFVAGGNPNLLPQNSTTTTIGFDYSPVNVSDLNISVTYNSTKFSDRIGSLLDSFGGGDIFGPTPTPLVESGFFPDAVRRDANGVLTFYDPFGSINISTRESQSIDFSVRKGFDSEMGSFDVGVAGTHVLKLEDTLFEGFDPIRIDGTQRAPSDWALNSFIDWRKGDWSASASLNHTSGYDNEESRAVSTDVSGFTTVNLSGTYAMGDSGWKFSAGVNNVFKADFPFNDSFFGVDSSRVDFRRRVFFVDVTKEFDF